MGNTVAMAFQQTFLDCRLRYIEGLGGDVERLRLGEVL